VVDLEAGNFPAVPMPEQLAEAILALAAVKRAA